MYIQMDVCMKNHISNSIRMYVYMYIYIHVCIQHILCAQEGETNWYLDVVAHVCVYVCVCVCMCVWALFCTKTAFLCLMRIYARELDSRSCLFFKFSAACFSHLGVRTEELIDRQTQTAIRRNDIHTYKYMRYITNS